MSKFGFDKLTTKELREKAVELHGQIKKMSDDHEQRKKDNVAADQLWTAEHQQAWEERCEQYDECREILEKRRGEEQRAARLAEQEEWLNQTSGQRTASPDDTVPGFEGRRLGEAGLETREESQLYQAELRKRHLAFESWACGGDPGILTDEHRQACHDLGFSPSRNVLEMHLLATHEFRCIQQLIRDTHPSQRNKVKAEILSGAAFGVMGAEQRSLSGLQGNTGGFITVPPSTVRSIEFAMVEFGAMLQLADTVTTETGEELSWPFIDDTSNEGEYVDEAEDPGEGSDPKFEQVKWKAYGLSSKFLKAPYTLTRDSIRNINQVLGFLIGERLGRKLSSECTTGQTRIQGIVPRTPTGNTTASSTAIVYDDILDLEGSLDPAHQGRASYSFHQNVLTELRKLKDGIGRPLWQPNVAVGAPDTFNGKMYTLNQKMSSTITSADDTILYGDHSAYKIRRVGPSLQLVRLVERFAEKRLTGYIGYVDADGNLLRAQATAASPIVKLTQA